MPNGLVPQRINIPISGGLDQSQNPEYIEAPGLIECTNFYHQKKNTLRKRPGYTSNQIVVDARNAQVTSWLVSPAAPLLSCPIERFLECDDAALFAARGWLWNYTPDSYGDFVGSLIPNTIRVGQIPDLELNLETAFGIDEANASEGLSIIDCASVASSGDLLCTVYQLHSTGSYTEFWARVTSRSNGNLINATRLVYSFTHAFARPCVVCYGDGFMATMLDITSSSMVAWKFDFSTMLWESATWPGLTLHLPYGGGPYTPTWYDLCGTGTADIHMAFVVHFDQMSVQGFPDPVSLHDSLFACTIDAHSMSIKYGAFYCGDYVLRQIGCLTYQAMFAIAGDDVGNYAATWINKNDGNVQIKGFYQQTFWPAPVQIGTTGTQYVTVALGFVAPEKQVDVIWNAMWEYYDTHLTAGGGYLTSVTSQTVGVNGDTSFVHRVYRASHIASNPWCVDGKSYAILYPSYPTYAQVPGASYADVPWILATTWSDQDTNDIDALSKLYQVPMAVWGYGTTFATQQPYRIQPDPSTPTGKAYGSLVVSDPFLRTYGIAVQATTFDSRGPNKYSSAPLPGGGCIFGCATPWIFDGDSAYEACYVMRPWVLLAAPFDGGQLINDTGDNGTHYIKILFEHQDAKGRKTRSAATDPIPVATTADYQGIDLQIVPPFWSGRKSFTGNAQVFMCRDGITYARVAILPIVALGPNDIPAYLSIEITAEPDALAPLIYTYDGTLENGYAPLTSHVVRWNNRIWLGHQNQLTHSQEFIDGEGLAFPPDYTEYLDYEITALTPWDDRMLLFNMDRVAYRTGEGPSENGQGGTYSNWAYITHEVGCVNARSVFHTMMGIFFQSRAHLEMLRGAGDITHVLEIEDLFAPTSDETGSLLLGVLSLPQMHQARFLYCDPYAGLKQLVLDYVTMTWSKWEGAFQWYGAAQKFFGDIQSVGDIVYLVDANGSIFTEFPARAHDVNIPIGAATTCRHINWSIKTPWIKIDGLLGVQRVWDSMLMFRVSNWTQSDGTVPQFGINVNCSTNYSEQSEVHATKTIDQLNELRNQDDSCYLLVGHVNQECSAYQLQLSSSDSTDYAYYTLPWGVYELLGIWSELAIEKATGRRSAESKI